MDIIVRSEQTCECGNTYIGMPAHCDICMAQGAQAFWAVVKGRLSLDEFMRYITGDMTFMSVMRRIRKAGGTDNDLRA